MNIYALAFSEEGMATGARLGLYTKRCADGGVRAWTDEYFYKADALVYIGACGIAVRAIAPCVKHKTSDPAVIVVDEMGFCVIPILSGHLGGANELAINLAQKLGAQPIITTATDLHGVAAADTWAKKNNMAVDNPKYIKSVSAKLLATGNAEAFITIRASDNADGLRLVPRIVTMGVGCKRGVSIQAIERAFDETLASADILPGAVRQICTIDIKQHEPGLVLFGHMKKLPIRAFTAQELMQVEGEFTRSDFVRQTTGADNVCERAAVLGGGGQILRRKHAYDGVTTALAIEVFIEAV